MNKIFIAGASGFAGKCLVKYLKNKKQKITSTAFKNTENNKNIKLDLTKGICLNKKFDWVVHIAAHHKIEDFKKNPHLKAKRNILMTKNLIDFTKRNKIRNYIFFSTIDINYKPYPLLKDIYIQSKVACEKILLNELKKKKLKKLVILRLPAVVGKKCGNNFIKNMLYNLKNNLQVNIWNKNSKYNNLIHINDLNRLIYYFISGKIKKNKSIIDCLSSSPIKLEYLVVNLKKKLDSKSKINYINKENKFRRIQYNSRPKYKFFNVKKAVSLLI